MKLEDSGTVTAFPTNGLRVRGGVLEQAWRCESWPDPNRRVLMRTPTKSWIEWRRVEEVPADAPDREDL